MVSGENLYKEYLIRIVVMVVSYQEMACLPRPAIANEVRVGVPIILYGTQLSSDEVLLQDKLPHPVTVMSKLSYEIIIELVDSISRDGLDTPIYVIQNKVLKNSIQIVFQVF